MEKTLAQVIEAENDRAKASAEQKPTWGIAIFFVCAFALLAALIPVFKTVPAPVPVYQRCADCAAIDAGFNRINAPLKLQNLETELKIAIVEAEIARLRKEKAERGR
jgi:hypothetical protein